ncbi:YAP-binding/ALF4/Glomulin [Phyllosticta citriasiana]|uniref:YAP-binding/ALF4/Glomulin n=1 Tax=Phyllosticta citriasiana TaxID=595635 RepID=A0ABR1KC95_9PEZI
MASDDEHPLLAGRPPVMDHLTYLTLIEHNLTPELLPMLHTVLQDAELTSNIGWDLVILLLPLLPASEVCLQDIARLGNPREVCLKVTEALRLLDFDGQQQEEEDDDEALARAADDAVLSDDESVGSKQGEFAPNRPSKAALPVLQFNALLSMLAILHPRIKTKYPSRFLSTTLQAVLRSYGEADAYTGDLTPAVTQFVKTLSGTKRPHLPPRTSSFSVAASPPATESAPDPEATLEDASSPEEDALQKRLLQSFLTHILEDYMDSLSSDGDLPALAVTSRVHEKLHPERTIPNKKSVADRFNEEEPLVARVGIVGQLAALAVDLELRSDDLYKTIIDPTPEAKSLSNEEDDPPASAADIPLSKTGALYLYTSRKVGETLYEQPSDARNISIFPDHATILQNFVGVEFAGDTGLHSDALIDSILALGVLAVEKNEVGEPKEDDEFVRYLQTTSLISANSPSPTLRYHAHYLTSTVLRSQPSDVVRLSFIRDTLEHCPYENLKAVAVGWLKGETVEANLSALQPSSQPSGHSHSRNVSTSSAISEVVTPSIFATPVALATTAPFLFPDLTRDLTGPSLSEAWTKFKLDLSFYLATLNFYIILLTAQPLHKQLDVQGLHEGNDVGGGFLYPLRQASQTFKKALGEGGELRAEGEDVESGLAELSLLEHVLDRVEEGVKALNGA